MLFGSAWEITFLPFLIKFPSVFYPQATLKLWSFANKIFNKPQYQVKFFTRFVALNSLGISLISLILNEWTHLLHLFEELLSRAQQMYIETSNKIHNRIEQQIPPQKQQWTPTDYIGQQRTKRQRLNPHASSSHISHSGTNRKSSLAHQQIVSALGGRWPSHDRNVGMLLHHKEKKI